MTSRARQLKDAPARRDSAQDLESLWNERGPAALEAVRTRDPVAYIKAIARLVKDNG